MSLSDKKNENTWSPLATSSLKIFAKEEFLRTEKTIPDYNRFKILFNDYQNDELDSFNLFNKDKKDLNKKSDRLNFFKQLYKENKDLVLFEKLNKNEQTLKQKHNLDTFKHTYNHDKYLKPTNNLNSFNQFYQHDNYLDKENNKFEFSFIVPESEKNLPIEQDSSLDLDSDVKESAFLNEKEIELKKQEGFNSGFDAGFNSGFDAGFNSGFNNSSSAGFDTGFKQGEKKGFDHGEKESFKEGFDHGEKQGFKKGFDHGEKESFKKGETKGFKQGFEYGEDKGINQGRKSGETIGYEKGFKKGEKKAIEDGNAKALKKIASLEDILLKINNIWDELIKKHEVNIISLVCKIVEKIVLAKVEIDNTLVRESVMHALNCLPEPEKISINVSTKDYEYIKTIKQEFFKNIKTLKGIRIVRNFSINSGGCKIESSKANVSTDLQSRLDAVFSSIIKAGKI